MQTARKPDWFIAASKSLQLIEENLCAYKSEDREAPNEAVINAVREFLKGLSSRVPKDWNIAEPKLFVSPNGQIVATMGCRPQTLNIRFAPEVTFLFKHPDLGTSKGNGLEATICLVLEHFRTF